MTRKTDDIIKYEWSRSADGVMGITPLDIRERQFKLRFKGFDAKAVDEFLEEIAESVNTLIIRNTALENQTRKMQVEIKERLEREAALTRALQQSHGALEKIQENAQRSAELIVSEAEVRAERILNRAHNRLAQLHEDIAGLKRQRVQIESQIRAIIESHSKLLDVAKEEMAAADEDFSKLKFLKKPPDTTATYR